MNTLCIHDSIFIFYPETCGRAELPHLAPHFVFIQWKWLKRFIFFLPMCNAEITRTHLYIFLCSWIKWLILFKRNWPTAAWHPVSPLKINFIEFCTPAYPMSGCAAKVVKPYRFQ